MLPIVRLCVVQVLLAIQAGVAKACAGDPMRLTSSNLSASIGLRTPIENGVVTFKWDCSPPAVLRYELVIEILRLVDSGDHEDEHVHTRGGVHRDSLCRRLARIDHNAQVQRSRHIMVKSVLPTACEYRAEELDLNCEYSVFVVAIDADNKAFACSNNQTFQTTPRLVQHSAVTAEIILSIGLVFLLWLCAVGAFMRQWKFVQLSTPYEATRHYKPQNVDQIRIINREEDGIIYRHSVSAPPRRMTSAGTTTPEQPAVLVVDETSKASETPNLELVERQATSVNDQSVGGRIPRMKRSMPCVNEMGLLEPLINNNDKMSNQRRNDAFRNELSGPQQLTIVGPADGLSKAESAPNIFITNLCTD